MTGDAVDPGNGLPAAKLQLLAEHPPPPSISAATAKGPEPRNLTRQENKMVRWVTFEMVYLVHFIKCYPDACFGLHENLFA